MLIHLQLVWIYLLVGHEQKKKLSIIVLILSSDILKQEVLNNHLYSKK